MKNIDKIKDKLFDLILEGKVKDENLKIKGLKQARECIMQFMDEVIEEEAK